MVIGQVKQFITITLQPKLIACPFYRPKSAALGFYLGLMLIWVYSGKWSEG